MLRLVIVAGVTAGCIANATACSHDARAAEPSVGPSDTSDTARIPVRTEAAAHDTSRVVVRAGGVTEPRATADLAFQVGGRVTALAVDEGTRVSRGRLLATLDATEYRLAYEQASLAFARESDELARARLLRASSSITANDFDKLENAARQAAVARAVAAQHLADARLVAPFAGTIAKKAIAVGATAGVGAPVLTLVDLREVEVRVDVSEADVGRLRVGRGAAVEVPALGTTVAGRVSAIGVAADPASRTYAVKITVPNAGGALRGGMVATAVLPTARARDVVTVPAAAVARDPAGATTVFVYAPRDGRVRVRRVDVGAPRGATVDVARGLAAGEVIIVAGQERVHDGARVTPAGGR